MKRLGGLFRRFHYNSPVILTMTFLSLLVLVIQELVGNYLTLLMFSVYRSSPLDIFAYFRIFGHVLGHQGWEHFTNNFLLILLIGPMLEEKYGSQNMLYMITATALVTGLVSIIFFKNIILLGASGVVFMLILLGSFVNFQKGRIPLTFVLVVAAYLGVEVARGLFIEKSITQLIHIIGGICGGLFGFKLTAGKEQG
ncbi:MAG: rhomboid family intramembrane serine protease [Clostridium sp.]|nr:rhomboid family intramembrane serine protease [Clostridium sp.]